MLKIKGLKKKKKGKKGKHKEEELFDPEELEQYRREHQQKAEAGEASLASGEGASSSEQGEEWQRFKALTAGVDDILKKTQDDLDRIKTTSYFQRKPPGSSNTNQGTPAAKGKKTEPKSKSKRWVGFEEGSKVDDETEPEEQPTPKEAEPEPVVEPEPQPVDEDEEEEESDQDEDIFDTSYVDVVASGNVKLAYIPDSPTEEENGFDPFDTSIVDKVIKTDPKKKNLVSLGSAVEVLTGRVDKPIPLFEPQSLKRRRPKKQDLLLGSFDELESSEEPKSIVEEPPPKSILDEESEFVADEIDLTINLATTLPPPSPLVERKELAQVNEHQVPKSIVEEFDIVVNTRHQTTPNVDLEEDLDDEFAALAAESILKEVVKDPFDDTNVPQLNASFITPVTNTLNPEDKFEEGLEDAVDPFDTTFASNVLPGKFELKLIEEEILFKEHEFPKQSVPKFLEQLPSVRLNDSTFNEHNFLDDDQTPLSFKHRDLLGGSTTDLSKISDCPIEPAAPNQGDNEIIYSDPFDTSVIDILVAPGKTELKFLEEELLADGIFEVESDDDFDPRAGSPPKLNKPITRPDQLPVGPEKRLSIPKVVAFNIETLSAETDLLVVGQEEGSKVSKPLTPYYADPKDINNQPSFESDSNFSDPFDTSFASHAPGKAELRLIESELVVETTLNHSLSDPDFNPRSEAHTDQSEAQTVQPNQVKPPSSLPVKGVYNAPENLRPDILSEEAEITVKLHTPVVPKKIEEVVDCFDYVDPFDTSIAADILPGKAELKILESELIHSDSGTSIKRSYTDPDFNPRDSPVNEEPIHKEVKNFIDHSEDISVTEKPLTPQSATSKTSFNIGEDIDPFDTSCVENLVPGKVELKLLESELFN